MYKACNQDLEYRLQTMVTVEKLKPAAVSFDLQNSDFESFDCEFGIWKIAAEKWNLNLAGESFDMTVVVAYTNVGSDSAIEVVENLVEVL